MDTQIEKEMIKKKLNYSMIFGILYFISALWLEWWENITGNSLLLFIGLIYAAYLVLKLTSKKKMIIVNLILFWKFPGFNPGMNGDFFKAGGSPGL